MKKIQNLLEKDPELKQHKCRVSWIQFKKYCVLFAELPYTQFVLMDKLELEAWITNGKSTNEIFEDLKQSILQKVKRMQDNFDSMEDTEYQVRLIDHNKFALATNGYARTRFLNFDVLLLQKEHYVYVDRSIAENIEAITKEAIENTKKHFEIAIEPIDQIRVRKKWLVDLTAIDPIGFGDGVLITSKSNNAGFVLLYDELLEGLAMTMKCEKLWLAPLDKSAMFVVPYEKRQNVEDFCSNTRKELAKLGYVSQENYIFEANTQQIFMKK